MLSIFVNALSVCSLLLCPCHPGWPQQKTFHFNLSFVSCTLSSLCCPPFPVYPLTLSCQFVLSTPWLLPPPHFSTILTILPVFIRSMCPDLCNTSSVLFCYIYTTLSSDFHLTICPSKWLHKHSSGIPSSMPSALTSDPQAMSMCCCHITEHAIPH